jgi:hypothetical protein
MSIAAKLIVSFALLAAAACFAEERCAHAPPHGGSFNVVGSCETGHAEAKLDGSTLKVWFTGSCCELKKPVRLPCKEIKLQVELKGVAGQKELILKAKPLALSGEKEGASSFFEGSAPWLSGAKEFVASAKLKFQGSDVDFKIVWPEGNDKDDDAKTAK